MAIIFDHCEAKEDSMTARSIRLVAFLIPLVAFGAGESFASSERSSGTLKSPQLAVCRPADSGIASRRTDGRIAFKCRCCGRDENGHCNHQCCD